MPLGPNVLWSADECGFRVAVRHGIRLIGGVREETLTGATLAEIRMQAAARAVELALQYRVPLTEVREAGEAV
jgi:hypothetical protein